MSNQPKPNPVPTSNQPDNQVEIERMKAVRAAKYKQQQAMSKQAPQPFQEPVQPEREDSLPTHTPNAPVPPSATNPMEAEPTYPRRQHSRRYVDPSEPDWPLTPDEARAESNHVRYYYGAKPLMGILNVVGAALGVMLGSFFASKLKEWYKPRLDEVENKPKPEPKPDFHEMPSTTPAILEAPAVAAVSSPQYPVNSAGINTFPKDKIYGA